MYDGGDVVRAASFHGFVVDVMTAMPLLEIECLPDVAQPVIKPRAGKSVDPRHRVPAKSSDLKLLALDQWSAVFVVERNSGHRAAFQKT
jgi:hypothetical protein